MEEYFQNISIVINKSAGVQSSCITYDKRSSYIGFIRGNICFISLIQKKLKNREKSVTIFQRLSEHITA